MKTDTTPIVRLEDYRPSDFHIEKVHLDISLHPTETRVISTITLLRNPAGNPSAPLALDGDELVLKSVKIEGEEVSPSDYEATPQSLVIRKFPERVFDLTIETALNPTANTKLMGLYRSNGIYCTQCEAEGFRRITYFLDRPDVMTVYTTRLEADRNDAPVLLGNGNPNERGDVPDSNRHYAIWHDPFPKPAYLFAVVGGNLDHVGKTFKTMSGRDVDIAVYVEKGKGDRADYALDALERSMRWDEQTFGREYDLEVFNVVAVSDFNMGAMENKGLNIFNDKYVLASSETATDGDYAGIESVIAHEYFHNWTGNRITCRDWFQLCLKEGLTVFRDQEFSADERSRPVCRISDIKTLRARQFPEDAGPLAHPVRPPQYSEINNFYTATVYEKGAELVRMLKTLIGADAFRKGMDIYFDSCDGTAATMEDFLGAFEQSSGKDLSHFAKWYGQAGTPHITVKGHYDATAKTYKLDFTQVTQPTPGQPSKEPLVIPVSLGLVTSKGDLPLDCSSVNENGVFVLDKASDSIVFSNVSEEPVPSVFRNFSAPVKVSLELDSKDLLTLLVHDSDPFNRWQAAQTIATRLLVRMVNGEDCKAEIEAFASSLLEFTNETAASDPAFTALVLTMPGESDIIQEIGSDIDPDAIFKSRTILKRILSSVLSPVLVPLYNSLANTGPYSPDAASAGKRSLRNLLLDLIACNNSAEGEKLAQAQIQSATNMTEHFAALSVLSHIPGNARENAFTEFGKRYSNEPLVLDKWFALQAVIPEESVLGRIERLTQNPAYAISNPNRVRAVYGAFAMSNLTQFNRADGKGYDLLADLAIKLDKINPQITARLLTAFGSWRRMNGVRQAHAEAALKRIAAQPDLSRDTSDIVQRSLA
ncbi:aminopeptidase N [Microvirga sp. W0021]|uniref:Aminopeptidase N n=1 Tax=Hohaiivirga grylli TaxID=3133970 RepID=A0ABV0BHK6_9HYPH